LLGILAVLWTFILGSAGLFLAWGELFTGHVAVYHNENLLHFNPLAILLVVLIPLMLAGRKWAMRPARIVMIAVVLCGLIGLLLKSFPFFYQCNWGMIALTLPPNLGLLCAMVCPRPCGVRKIFVGKRTQLPVN
jgi:hypothetical protein